MKKHNYRTKNVNEINWPELGQQLGGEAVTFAVDVAKAQQYALLTNDAQSLSIIVKWELLETKGLIHELKQLGCPVTVVMESTGTYGDAMRHQIAFGKREGSPVHRRVAAGLKNGDGLGCRVHGA